MARSTDPVSDALLTIFEARTATQQAVLDLERARAKEQAAARGAVPGVIAQLQQTVEKEAKRREAIQRAEAQAQAQAAPKPQEMIPQPVEPSGAPQRPQVDVGALGGVAQLAGRLIGAGGPQPAQAGVGGPIGPAGTFQPTFPQAGGAQAGPGGAPSTPPPPPAQPGAPAPSPIQPIPVAVPLSTGQRVLRTGIGLAAAAGRQFGTAAPLLEQGLITGTEQIGFITLEQQTAGVAKSLAIFQARRTSTDPAVARAAEQQYQNAIDQIRSAFPPELADAAVRVAEMQAANIRLQAEEEKRLLNEDPLIQAQREAATTKARLITKLAKEGPGALTEGEKAVLKLEQRGTEVEVKILQPATVTDLEKRSRGHFDVINRLSQLDQAIYPEFFALGAEREVRALELLAKSGAKLSQENVDKINRYRHADKVFGTFTKDSVTADAGKTMTPMEAQLVADAIPTKDMTYEGAKQAIADQRYLFGLDTFRDLTMRKAGLSDDPALAQTFAETEVMAEEAIDESVRRYMDQGLSPDEALDRTSRDFRNSFGLDVERVLASPVNVPMSREP